MTKNAVLNNDYSEGSIRLRRECPVCMAALHKHTICEQTAVSEEKGECEGTPSARDYDENPSRLVML